MCRDQYFAVDGKELDIQEATEENLECKLQNILLTDIPQGMIGYDERTGLATVILKNKQKPTKIKIGRLLHKLGKSKEIILEVSTKAASDVAAFKAVLKITQSAEEVIRVYEDGPHSCMRGEECVAVYNTETVRVAYLEIGGKVIARVVVGYADPENPTYSIPYGFKEPLVEKLEELGYTAGDLYGCKVAIVKDEDGIILMPYIDGNNMCSLKMDHIFVGEGDILAGSTDGYFYRTCECCGSNAIEDELIYSDYLGESLCRCCYDEVHVDIGGTDYHKEDEVIVITYNGEYELGDDCEYIEYLDECVLRNECTLNTFTNEYQRTEDLQEQQ